MNPFKFDRYTLYIEKKKYTVLIPHGVNSNLWIIDWADWWYGTFLDGSLQGLSTLDACFAILGYNPHIIVYLPIKNTLIPKNMTHNPTNGKYDVVFMTEQSRIKSNTWTKIRQKMKKVKPTQYIYQYNFERNKFYFEKKLRKYKNIYDDTLVNKARGDSWLYADTAFFVFPIQIYQRNSTSFHECFFVDLTQEDIDICYNQKDDSWTCYTHFVFSYGLRDKWKLTEEEPGLTLNIELYDVEIANKYLKKKDKLVNPREVEHSDYFRNENYIKIEL